MIHFLHGIWFVTKSIQTRLSKRKDDWKRSRTPPRPRNEAARDEGEKSPEEKNSRNPSARYLVYGGSNPAKRKRRKKKRQRESVRPDRV